MSTVNQNKVSSFEFIYQVVDSANRKDFNGFSLKESSVIYGALTNIQEKLIAGEKAIEQLERQKEAVKDSIEVARPIDDNPPQTTAKTLVKGRQSPKKEIARVTNKSKK